jgi:hypothetical protein
MQSSKRRRCFPSCTNPAGNKRAACPAASSRCSAWRAASRFGETQS